MRLFSEPDQSLSSYVTTTGTTDWTRYVSPILTAPATAAKLEVNGVTDPGSGTAYVDALRVESAP